jgi:hypothetical protein
MSSTVTTATARLITATAKAAAPGVRFTTASQGPYSFRVVLPMIVDGHGGALGAAGLAAEAIRGVDGGSRFTATWGRARTGKIVINVTDETAREAAVAELARAREEALAAARIEVAVEQWGPDAVAVTRQYDDAAHRCEVCGEDSRTCSHSLTTPDSDEVTDRTGTVVGRTELNGLGWDAWDTDGIRRVTAASTRHEAAERLVEGIAYRAERAAEEDRWAAEESARWTPDEVLPSGKYGVKLVDRGYGPSLHVTQLIEKPGKPARWGATPGCWGLDTLAGHAADRLSIDHGAGWVLPAADTAALVARARAELQPTTAALADAAAEATGHPAGAAHRWTTGNPSLWV